MTGILLFTEKIVFLVLTLCMAIRVGAEMPLPGQLAQVPQSKPRNVSQNQQDARIATDHYGDPLPFGAFLRLGTNRLHQKGPVYAVAWSGDGKWFASAVGKPNKTVSLWDAQTGKEIRSFKDQPIPLRSLAISADGALAVSVDLEGNLTLWDTKTTKALRVERVAGGAPVAFAPDGKAIASIDAQGRACLLQTATLQEQQLFSEGNKLQARVTLVTLSANGKTLASADTLSKIRFFDALTGKFQRVLEYGGKVDCLSLAPDGRMLAVGADKAIHLWDATSGQKLRQLDGHQNQILTVAWSPDGKSLVSGSADGTARTWDAENGLELMVERLPDQGKQK